MPYEDLAQDLTLIGIMGIEDSLCEGGCDAAVNCHKASVTVNMCTGDNSLTVRLIATRCGIFTPSGITMEGPVCRKLTQSEMVKIVLWFQVLVETLSPSVKSSVLLVIVPAVALLSRLRTSVSQ